MAVTFTELSADYLAWFAADKPMMLGQNLLRATLTDYGWAAVGKDTGDAGTLDATGFEGTHAFDDFDHDLTKIDAAYALPKYLVDFGEEVEFDTIVLLNHNLWTFATPVVQVYAGSTATFTAEYLISDQKNTTEINPSRFAILNCSENGTGSMSTVNARYLSIGVHDSSGNSTPSIGEIIIGKRTQLKHAPNEGFDGDNFYSGASRFVSNSGIGTVYSNYTNQRRLALQLKAWEDDRKTDLRTFFRDYTHGGTKNFVWWDKPSSAPQEFNWMQFEQSSLSGPSSGPLEQNFGFVAVEQGPNFLANE